MFFQATLLLAAVRISAPAAPVELANGRIRARFDDRGLAALYDAALNATFEFRADNFGIAIDGTTYDSAALSPPVLAREDGRLRYRYAAGPYQVDAVYELRPGWRFVSKQLWITAPPGSRYRVNRVDVFRSAVSDPAPEGHLIQPSHLRPDLQTRNYGLVMRLGGGQGLLVLVQNPFLEIQQTGGSFVVGYQPEMSWETSYGAFPSDRGCIGPYALTGRRLPPTMRPEWQWPSLPETPSGLDAGEVEAFTECVRSFLVNPPEKPLHLFVGWCVNDYQIDAGTPAGRAEYRRIIDRAAELGAGHVLYAPANSLLSRREDSADDWNWENLLWLGLGQQIRRNEWHPKSDPIPPSVQQMLDYAQSKKVKLVAYVYPSLPFSQNPEWLVQGSKFHAKKANASLGVRSFQDWLIENLGAFKTRTGIGGYSFDYTFLWYDGTSRYAQWFGWRRVMEELRKRFPDIAIDGRQLYMEYGPWIWLAGSYPHPSGTDEQPESFTPFPDLHFDRVSADRQRYTAYRYRNYEFCPTELLPGFITHQTPRLKDAGDIAPAERLRDPRRQDGELVLTRFRPRDWDYLGWRYSLLSSIATAGWNNVLNMIPARDPDEYRAFSTPDRQFFRQWLDWASENREYLRHTRTILGEPGMGRADGTSAIVGGQGFLFLFNPNARQVTAEFTLDASIGLTGADRFLLEELYPLRGRLIGKPETGIWHLGDKVALPLGGTTALVLKISPAPAAISAPILFNAPGHAELADAALNLRNVRGEVGAVENLLCLLPDSGAVRRVAVNGRTTAFTQHGRTVSITVDFAGAPFAHSQQVGPYDPAFTGGKFTSTFRIPGRIRTQLAARRKAWPIPWTEEDLNTTWLAPERLLLFLQIAEPDDKMPVTLRLNGSPVELKRAYSSIRLHSPSFVGFYADVSSLQPDAEYRLELDLPQVKPGQFQGVFFDNVETEYTAAVEPGARARTSKPNP